MLAFSCVSWAGVASSRWHAQRNGIARRSTSGARSSGLRSKRGEEQRTTVVWVDESAFYLLPLAVRTWAPRDQMPILRTRFSRDHLSVISGITLTEQLYLEVQDHAYTAESVVIFLHHLLDQITGHVTVIWDGAPIHRSRVINQFLAEGGQAPPSGTLAGLCAGSQPGRRRVELSQARRTGERLLSRSGRLDRSGTAGHTAGAGQTGATPRLFSPMRLPGLVVAHDISKCGFWHTSGGAIRRRRDPVAGASRTWPCRTSGA